MAARRARAWCTSWTRLGQETVLYSFTGGTDGANPLAGLIRDSAGNLYGTASNGGNSLSGLVFALDPAAAGGNAAQATPYSVW